MNNDSVFRAALKYAKQGLPVFPCRPNKRPFTKNGFLDASIDPDKVRNWWIHWPNAMIGMPTGKLSGVSVVDVGKDPLPTELDQFVKANARGCAKQRTMSGGYHQLYKHVDGVPSVGHDSSRGEPDIDIRGEGGYVILAPSIGKNGQYRWVRNMSSIKESFPVDLVGMLRSRRNGNKPSSKPPEEVEIGERYPVLRSLIAGLWNRNVSIDEALDRAKEFNEQMADPVPNEQWERLVHFGSWLEDEAETKEDMFWIETPILDHIRSHAQANRTAPWPVLGCELARVAAATHPKVQLPGRGSGANKGSLNLFVALVGEPGKGKDQALAEARSAIELGDDDIALMRLGSGEGLAHAYKGRKRASKDEPYKEVWLRRQVMFEESEIETVLKLGGRQGSTLISELRSAWNAGKLGHMFVDPQKRLDIPTHSYRMSLVVGVQPSKAGVILDDSAGGMPQRFLWLLCSDRWAPDFTSSEYELKPIQLAYAEVLDSDPEDHIIPVCQSAVSDIDDFAKRSLRGEYDGDPLRGHWLQSKLKVAGLLAIMHGCTEVDDEWWRIADLVMKRSDEGRAVCAYHSWLEHGKVIRGKAKDAAVIAVTSAEAVEEKKVGRCRKGILKVVKPYPSWVAMTRINRSLRSDLKDILHDTLDLMVSEGVLRVRTRGSGGQISQQYQLAPKSKW
jgi:hypothetical protein